MPRRTFMGAFNKETKKYIPPKRANKTDKYMCPDCKKDLILCQGTIIEPYFRHKTETNPCNYYASHTSESQQHKEGKLRMQYILENNKKITLRRKCNDCNTIETITIDKYPTKFNIKLEHTFIHNERRNIADVAFLNEKGELVYIFEIYHTHHVRKDKRPEPWFEINCNELINIDLDEEYFNFNCIRSERCKKCVVRDEQKQHYYSSPNVRDYNKTSGLDLSKNLYFDVKYEDKETMKKF